MVEEREEGCKEGGEFLKRILISVGKRSENEKEIGEKIGKERIREWILSKGKRVEGNEMNILRKLRMNMWNEGRIGGEEIGEDGEGIEIERDMERKSEWG